jgi:hypothetical protein
MCVVAVVPCGTCRYGTANVVTVGQQVIEDSDHGIADIAVLS